jgi:hypothetical protein
MTCESLFNIGPAILPHLLSSGGGFSIQSK